MVYIYIHTYISACVCVCAHVFDLHTYVYMHMHIYELHPRIKAGRNCTTVFRNRKMPVRSKRPRCSQRRDFAKLRWSRGSWCPGRELIYTGWWLQPLWKILVSWDDYSQYMEKYIIFQTTNQFLASTVKWGFLNCKLDPQSHGWTVSIRSAMGMITRIFVIIPSRDVRSRYYPKQPPKMTEKTFITILEWDLTCLSFWGLLHV